MAETYISQANKIIGELNELSTEFIKSVQQKANEEKINKIPSDVMKHVDRSTLLPPCPITNNVPDMTESERQSVAALCEKIKQEINKEPYKFNSQIDDRKDHDFGSKGIGNKDEVIELIYVTEPEWIKEIKTFCNRYKKSKGREYFDEEMLVRGRLSMKKARTKSKNDALYLLLDVSGSMWYFSYNGVPLLQLMASYMPKFASKFEGYWVQTDGARIVISEMRELKKLQNKGRIRLTGGSGADYIVAIQTIVDHSINHSGESDPTIVLFSDMHEEFPNPMPRNLALVTTGDKAEMIRTAIKDSEFPNEKKNQKVILIDID